MAKYNQEEIKKLIGMDFDLELISFELEISIEEVKRLHKEMVEAEAAGINRGISKSRNRIDNRYDHSKIEEMRKRYHELSGKSYGDGLKTQRDLTLEEEEVANSVISNVEKMVEQTKEMQKNEIRENAWLIRKEIYKIADYPLTIEQLEKLNFLMASNTLQKLRISPKDRIDWVIAKARKMIILKMVKAIDIAQSQTEELEELKILERKITTEMRKVDPISAGAVKSKIRNKITKLQQQEVIDRIKNDISANIETIISNLVNGTLDVQEANRIINEEAKRKADSKPKAKFSLNEEQERKQVLIQIKTVLIEKAEEYQIVNPEASIKQAQELFGDGIEQAIRMVVMNLAGGKKFETAKEICDKYSNGEDFYGPMSMMKREVKNAEIGNMVLRGINMHGTVAEENEYFELLEKGLKNGNVRLGSISLGKSKDGLRNITLADIWVDERQRGK